MQNHPSPGALPRPNLGLHDLPASELVRSALLPLREPFGAWLIAQHDREDALDGLARVARSTPAFPRRGTPYEVYQHLRRSGTDQALLVLLADAERCWAGL